MFSLGATVVDGIALGIPTALFLAQRETFGNTRRCEVARPELSPVVAVHRTRRRGILMCSGADRQGRRIAWALGAV